MKTAVNNIIEFCKEQKNIDVSSHRGAYSTIIKFCEEQAKELEKKQIIQSHLQGSKNSIIEVSKYINVNNTLDIIKNIEKGLDEHCDGIKYYNETFNK